MLRGGGPRVATCHIFLLAVCQSVVCGTILYPRSALSSEKSCEAVVPLYTIIDRVSFCGFIYRLSLSGLLDIRSFVTESALTTNRKKPWSKLQDEDRNLAVNKWLQIVLKNPMCIGVARNFFESKTLGFCSGSLSDSIAECMATKATSTLHTRANHFLRYLTWAEKQGVIALPLTEPAVHHYFVLCAGSVAPTAFRSFLSSVGFAKFVVGLNPADPVLLSGRVRGLAAQTYMEKRPLRQREPLLVGEVSRLEEIVTDEARARPDRVASGYFLFLVYGRARYSDGQRVVRLKLSSCCKHLEAEVERSKSSMTLERKTRLLPITANAEGLKGMQWGRLWFVTYSGMRG